MTTAKVPSSGSGAPWTSLGRLVDAVGTRFMWQSGPILVASSLIVAEMPDGNGTGEQWLVSVSANRKRPKPHHVRRALRAFDMTAAEEDNHEPGVARKFFLVVDPARRVDCECKTTEETIVEPDGFRWSNPKRESGEECRGCQYQRLLGGKPCPIHATAAP
jgi:hypothetical protein